MISRIFDFSLPSSLVSRARGHVIHDGRRANVLKKRDRTFFVQQDLLERGESVKNVSAVDDDDNNNNGGRSRHHPPTHSLCSPFSRVATLFYVLVITIMVKVGEWGQTKLKLLPWPSESL